MSTETGHRDFQETESINAKPGRGRAEAGPSGGAGPRQGQRRGRSRPARRPVKAGLGVRTQDWCQETPRWVFEGRHRVGATLSVGHHAFIRRCVVVRIPSLSRRSEPAPTRDENLDGRVDGRDTPVTETGQSDDSVGRPVVTDRDADQTTYRSAGATGGQTSEAERRANERAAVARAATGRPAETEPRGTARPVAPEPVNGTTRPVAPEPVSGDVQPGHTRAPHRPHCGDRVPAHRRPDHGTRRRAGRRPRQHHPSARHHGPGHHGPAGRPDPGRGHRPSRR